MASKPLIVIIDLDGTMIGDITPQLLLQDIKSTCKNVRFSNKDLFDRFDKGLLRPGIDTFIKHVKKMIPHIEFYVYTASDEQWANYVITNIEKHLSIRFNRPIFTRNHCFLVNGGMLKCFKHIMPFIQRSLQKKYGKKFDVTNRVLLIDNTKVYQPNEQHMLLHCPTYEQSIPENIPAMFNEHTFEQYKPFISNKLKRLVPSLDMSSYINFQKTYYTYYVDALQKLSIKEPDRFWLFLTRLIELKNINIFTPKAVEYINKKLNKRLINTPRT